MPDFEGYTFINLSPLIAAWTMHYMAKGCAETKARQVAVKRVQSKMTWPGGGLKC
ncbi:MAG: hypothetical protein GY938_24560 [Ketobacter sp.]|nr:hypothetical protein [Ketobacter sp.]